MREEGQTPAENQTRYKLLRETGGRLNHKLRYLLYFSGYWTGTGNWKKLEEYAALDKVCAPGSAPMPRKKIFYVYSLKSHTQGNYVPAEISEGSNHTVWDTGCLFWNCADVENDKALRLERVKECYDDFQNYLAAASKPVFPLTLRQTPDYQTKRICVRAVRTADAPHHVGDYECSFGYDGNVYPRVY